MSKVLRRLAETFSLKTKSGYAVPQKTLVYETPRVPLADVISLYERDPTCKASVDLLAASADTSLRGHSQWISLGERLLKFALICTSRLGNSPC